jgi:WD40 repeat protein
MTATWEALSKERKQKKKSLVVLPPEMLEKFGEIDKKNWHKTRNKAGIVDMKAFGTQIVTAGRDKQLVVYSLESKQLVHTIGTGAVVTSVDINSERIVAAKPDGQIVQYVNGSAVGEPLELNATIVDVTLHPTGKHVVATTENGSVVFCGIQESGMEIIYTFSAPDETTYSSGVLHPDGLICAAGTSMGAVHLWDFKNQKLADTLEVRRLLVVMRRCSFVMNANVLTFCLSLASCLTAVG